jgi:hypothetical protein
MVQLSASLSRPLLSMGTVKDRCYGHAEGTTGEDHAGACLAAMVAT